MPYISKKFRQNPFTTFSVIRRTDKRTEVKTAPSSAEVKIRGLRFSWRWWTDTAPYIMAYRVCRKKRVVLESCSVVFLTAVLLVIAPLPRIIERSEWHDWPWPTAGSGGGPQPRAVSRYSDRSVGSVMMLPMTSYGHLLRPLLPVI